MRSSSSTSHKILEPILTAPNEETALVAAFKLLAKMQPPRIHHRFMDFFKGKAPPQPAQIAEALLHGIRDPHMGGICLLAGVIGVELNHRRLPPKIRRAFKIATGITKKPPVEIIPYEWDSLKPIFKNFARRMLGSIRSARSMAASPIRTMFFRQRQPMSQEAD